MRHVLSSITGWKDELTEHLGDDFETGHLDSVARGATNSITASVVDAEFLVQVLVGRRIRGVVECHVSTTSIAPSRGEPEVRRTAIQEAGLLSVKEGEKCNNRILLTYPE